MSGPVPVPVPNPSPRLDPAMSGDNWCHDGTVRHSAYQQQLQEHLEDKQQAAVFSLLSSSKMLLQKIVSLSTPSMLSALILRGLPVLLCWYAI